MQWIGSIFAGCTIFGCTCLAGEELHNYNQYNDGLVIIVALPNSIYLN
jgi:hypothetical protein